MTQASTKPGLPLTIPFAIPAYWTPEQAQAVVELLDGLSERIVAHYQLQLIDLYREQQGAAVIDPLDFTDDDLPF
jgi:hypothetical protein